MKKYLTNILAVLSKLQTLYILMKNLNDTVFADDNVTFTELYQWCKLHGMDKVIYDLQKMYDHHHDYDKETL